MNGYSFIEGVYVYLLINMNILLNIIPRKSAVQTDCLVRVH